MQGSDAANEQKNRSMWVRNEAILQRNGEEGALQHMEEILQQKSEAMWEHILQPNGEEKRQLQQQRLIQEEEEEARRRVRARPMEMEERLRIAARTLRPTGGKDRHSKVNTARGPRDRRVRLSVPTAVMFYEVQDRLGFDQPSKAVEWLMTKAKSAIDELADLPFPVTTTCSSSSVAVAVAAASSSSSSPRPRLFCPQQHEDPSVKPPWQIHPHRVDQPRMDMNSLLPHIPSASTSASNPLTLPPSHFSFPSPDHHSSFNPLSHPCSTSSSQARLFSSSSTTVSHSHLRLAPQHFGDPCLDFPFQPQFSSSTHIPARIQGLYEEYPLHKGSS